MTAKTAPAPVLFSSSGVAAEPEVLTGVLRVPQPVLTVADLPPLLDAEPSTLGLAYMWTIVPEMARYLLERHNRIVESYKAEERERDGHNRKLRWRDITTYGNDIVASRWARNGATVTVTWDGLVSDGQHRLKACTTTETPFESYVVFGIDISAQDTQDANIRRKLGDQFDLRGEANATNLATIARWLWRWQRGARNRTSSTIPNPSERELIEFVSSDERLRVATAWAVRAYNQFRYARVSVYAMSWILFYAIDPASAEMFLDAVSTGANIGVNHPAWTLRNRLMQPREKLTEHQQLALMIMAWNAFRAERSPSKYQLPVPLNQSNFPEPR